jgi:hypothetical protein
MEESDDNPRTLKQVKPGLPYERRHYPTDTELAYLSNAGQFEELDRRLDDRTRENMMLDIMETVIYSPPIVFVDTTNKIQEIPRELVEQMAIRMDVRAVLAIANKSAIFFGLISSDVFWKHKFANDFPEVMYLFDKTQLPAALQLPGNGLFKTSPWRRLYYVIRYRLREALVKSFEYYGVKRRGNLEFKFIFDRVSGQIQRTVSFNGNQIGNSQSIGVSEYLTKHFFVSVPRITRHNYLWVLAAFCIWKRENDDIEHEDDEVKYPHGEEEERVMFRVYSTSYIYLTRMLLDLIFNVQIYLDPYDKLLKEIERGYAKLRNDGVPFIGAALAPPPCIVCLGHGTAHESQDPDRVFCAASCQAEFYRESSQ